MEIRLATNEIVRAYLTRPWPKATSKRPGVRINMVSSFDGKVNLPQDDLSLTEAGLGSNLDKYLMKVLRTRADMVLNGAETLRLSSSEPKVDRDELSSIREKEGFSKHPIGAVISKKGADLPLKKAFFNNPDYEAVVFVSESAPKVNIKKIQATGRKVFTFPDNDFKALAEIIRTRFGVERLLLEGGPSIAAEFVRAGLVDEIYQTLSYTLVSGSENQGIKTFLQGATFKKGELKKLTPLSIFYVPETNELYQSVQVEN
ncbi:MAG: dihydrofolate reductase family protein [bacterium]|nr:dihydrofolate reductase family protein [bacterium]